MELPYGFYTLAGFLCPIRNRANSYFHSPWILLCVNSVNQDNYTLKSTCAPDWTLWIIHTEQPHVHLTGPYGSYTLKNLTGPYGSYTLKNLTGPYGSYILKNYMCTWLDLIDHTHWRITCAPDWILWILEIRNRAALLGPVSRQA